MKRILCAVALSMAIISCQPKSNNGTTIAAVDGFYGVEINEENAIDLAELLSNLEGTDSMIVKVKATIKETCAVKGCWMTVDIGNEELMRVTFKDYGFFVPKEGMEGKSVIFEGLIKRDYTSVENLRHYAMDAGKSQEEIDQITEGKEELSFEATGVIIKETNL